MKPWIVVFGVRFPGCKDLGWEGTPEESDAHSLMFKVKPETSTPGSSLEEMLRIHVVGHP